MFVIKNLLLFFLSNCANPEKEEKCSNKAKLPKTISYRSHERLMKYSDRFKSFLSQRLECAIRLNNLRRLKTVGLEKAYDLHLLTCTPEHG